MNVKCFTSLKRFCLLCGLQEEFENTKRVTRIRKSKKYRQHNGRVLKQQIKVHFIEWYANADVLLWNVSNEIVVRKKTYSNTAI